MIPRNTSTIIICFLLVFWAKSVAISQEVDPNDFTSQADYSGSYCGIYCLYAGLKYYDIEVDFSDLLNPSYIGSPKGSSVAELTSAAEDYGMAVMPLGKMGLYELKNLKYPALLHVKPPDVATKEYSHYELFLGIESGQVKLYNPPDPIRLVDFRDVISRWDGVAVILLPQAKNYFSIFPKSIIRGLVLCVFIAIIVITLRKIQGEQKVSVFADIISNTIKSSFAILLTAITFGLVFHYYCDYGFLSETSAVSNVAKEYESSFLLTISKREVVSLLGTNTLIIDARFAKDYRSGHIAGAVNIPIDLNGQQFKESLSGLSKESQLVLYSQDRNCPFARGLAMVLKEYGYNNISIFKGGWIEWAGK